MLDTIKSRLVADWRWVLKNSWSVKLIVLAAVLSGAEVVLPLLSNWFAPGLFAVLSFFVTAGALIARFVAQKKDD